MFRLQLLATVTDLDTTKSNPQLHTAFLYSTLQYYPPIKYIKIFLSGFPTRNVRTFLTLAMRATCVITQFHLTFKYSPSDLVLILTQSTKSPESKFTVHTFWVSWRQL